MQMKGSWREADTNGDGIITLDELTAKLGNYSQSRSPASSGPSAVPNSGTVASSPVSASTSSGGASGNSGGSNDNSSATMKKSYRFLSAQERLPRGLPDWFSRKDTNGDGQVSMAEYAPGGWSDALAEEFAKYDQNGDGVITPEECLKASASK